MLSLRTRHLHSGVADLRARSLIAIARSSSVLASASSAQLLLLHRSSSSSSSSSSSNASPLASSAIHTIPSTHAQTHTAKLNAQATSSSAAPSPTAAPAPAAAMPVVMRRLYRQLLRVSRTYDRVPILKAALMHPASEYIDDNSVMLSTKLRRIAQARNAEKMVTLREATQQQQKLKTLGIEISKGAMQPQQPLSRPAASPTPTTSSYIPLRSKPTPAAGAIPTTNEVAAASEIFSKLPPTPMNTAMMNELQWLKHTLEAHQSSTSSDSGNISITNSNSEMNPVFERLIEARARDIFFTHMHGAKAQLSTRLFWTWLDRVFRRPVQQIVTDPPTQTSETAQTSADPSLLTAEGESAIEKASTPLSTKPTASLRPASLLPSDPVVTAFGGSTFALSGSTLPPYLSMSPFDTEGTCTPQHYLPTRSLSEHIRSEFRQLTFTPDAKQQLGMTQALFQVLKWLNEEKICYRAATTTEAETSAAKTVRNYLTHLLSHPLPADLLQHDPAVLFDPATGSDGIIPNMGQKPTEASEQHDEQWQADLDAMLADDAAAAAKNQTHQSVIPTSIAPTPSAAPSIDALPTPFSYSSGPLDLSHLPLPNSISLPSHWHLHPSTKLGVGTILAAHPQMSDGDFLQSMILITKFDREKNLAQGVFLNRPYVKEDGTQSSVSNRSKDGTDHSDKKFLKYLDKLEDSDLDELGLAKDADDEPTEVELDLLTDTTATKLTPPEIKLDRIAQQTSIEATVTPTAAPTAAPTATPTSAPTTAAATPPQDPNTFLQSFTDLADSSFTSPQSHRQEWIRTINRRFPGIQMRGGPEGEEDEDDEPLVLHRRLDWAKMEYERAQIKRSTSSILNNAVMPPAYESNEDGTTQRELTPPVFIGSFSYWADILEWAQKPTLNTKWENEGLALLTRQTGAHRKLIVQKRRRSLNMAAVSSTSSTNAAATSDSPSSLPLLSPPSPPSPLHAWDVQIYHGYVSWAINELQSQIEAGDWFIYSGSSSHVFTSLVPQQLVEERKAVVDRRETLENVMSQNQKLIRRGMMKNQIVRKKKLSSSATSVSTNRSEYSFTPFELASTPVASARDYAHPQTFAAADAADSSEAELTPSAADSSSPLPPTPHRPSSSSSSSLVPHFPQSRLWNHAMWQLGDGDGRHWAYLPQIGLSVEEKEDTNDDDDDDLDDDDDDIDIDEDEDEDDED